MPILAIHTNVSQKDIKPELLYELSKTVAKLLHKPEKYVEVHILGDQAMTFSGSDGPCAYATLKSIGGVGPNANGNLAKTLFPIITKGLNITGDRMYIEFIDIPGSSIAYNGSTF